MELFTRRLDDSTALLLVSRFFGHPRNIFNFMTRDVIKWMENCEIPSSIVERERLIKLIKRARVMFTLFTYAASSFIVLLLFLGLSSALSSDPTGTFLLVSVTTNFSESPLHLNYL